MSKVERLENEYILCYLKKYLKKPPVKLNSIHQSRAGLESIGNTKDKAKGKNWVKRALVKNNAESGKLVEDPKNFTEKEEKSEGKTEEKEESKSFESFGYIGSKGVNRDYFKRVNDCTSANYYANLSNEIRSFEVIPNDSAEKKQSKANLAYFIRRNHSSFGSIQSLNDSPDKRGKIKLENKIIKKKSNVYVLDSIDCKKQLMNRYYRNIVKEKFGPQQSDSRKIESVIRSSSLEKLKSFSKFKLVRLFD